ncbi:MAG: TRAP transporter small permease [Deltaproteobacteria bacterium]|nr:MAG: TRAP transporter small permease [Deltaproteobacteria bacterium]
MAMDSLSHRLNRFEEGLVGFSLLGLALLTCLETVLRYTINYSFVWFQEFSNYMIIFMTFLGASIGVKYGTHFSMDALVQYTPDRISHLVKTIAYFISGTMTLFFVYFGIKHLLRLRGFGVNSAAMGIPMFIPYLPIPLFSLSMSFRFYRQSYKHLKSLLNNESFEKVRRKD